METQVKSKKRVADHSEVSTGKREVNTMLDLVKQETDRIDSRFLEPACGDGNFLLEILERKLRIVEERYTKSQLDYERNAVFAVSAIYGIDILEDNIRHCRERLFGIFELNYLRLFKTKASDGCRKSVRFILECNIIHGDALSLKTVGENPQPIVFSEWSPVNGSMPKRRDFTLSGLSADWHLNIDYDFVLQAVTATLAACDYLAVRASHYFRVLQSRVFFISPRNVLFLTLHQPTSKY